MNSETLQILRQYGATKEQMKRINGYFTAYQRSRKRKDGEQYRQQLKRLLKRLKIKRRSTL